MSKNSENKLKEIWNDKKKRSKLNYTIFFTILGILFIVNNLNSESGEGNYPPDYYKLKNSANQEAPKFTLKDLNDEDVNLENFQGKVVILKFWSVLSEGSQKMAKDLIQLKEKYKDSDFEILALSIDELSNNSFDEVKKYAELNGINYPVLRCNQITSNKYGNVKEVPVTYIIKKDGKIYTRYDNWTPRSILERDINLLLK